SWSHDRTARLWNAADGMPIGQPMPHDGWATGAQFSADGQRILSWGNDGAHLWNGVDGMPIGQPMHHMMHEGRNVPGDRYSRVLGAQFSADEKRILSWSEHGSLRLWDATNSQPIGVPMLHQAGQGVGGAQFSADGKTILSWSMDHTARLWKADDGQPI